MFFASVGNSVLQSVKNRVPYRTMSALVVLRVLFLLYKFCLANIYLYGLMFGAGQWLVIIRVTIIAWPNEPKSFYELYIAILIVISLKKKNRRIIRTLKTLNFVAVLHFGPSKFSASAKLVDAVLHVIRKAESPLPFTVKERKFVPRVQNFYQVPIFI